MRSRARTIVASIAIESTSPAARTLRQATRSTKQGSASFQLAGPSDASWEACATKRNSFRDWKKAPLAKRGVCALPVIGDKPEAPPDQSREILGRRLFVLEKLLHLALQLGLF